MRIFTGLQVLIRRIRGQEKLPELFGLSQGERSTLLDWRGTPSQMAFVHALDTKIQLYAEALLAASTSEQVFSTRGKILGIREAAFLVDEIAQKEQELHARTERNVFNEQHAGDAVVAATFGSPYWRRG